MSQEKLAEILAALRSALTTLLGDQLVAIYLYGSQARGDARPDSDIDVLVVLQEQFDYFEMVQRTGDVAAELSLAYDTVLALAFTSQQNFEHKMTPFLMNVRKEGIAA